MKRRLSSFADPRGLVLGLAILLTCAYQQSVGGSVQAQGTSSKAQLYGHWVYASGESEGSSTAVYGDLKLAPDGTFEDNRRIGGIGGFRRGTFSVRGDQLTLKFDKAKSSQIYTVSFGSTRDKGGKELKTLLLKSTGLSFLLTKKQVAPAS